MAYFSLIVENRSFPQSTQSPPLIKTHHFWPKALSASLDGKLREEGLRTPCDDRILNPKDSLPVL